MKEESWPFYNFNYYYQSWTGVANYFSLHNEHQFTLRSGHWTHLLDSIGIILPFSFYQVKNGVSKAGDLSTEISAVDLFERLQPLDSLAAYEEGGDGDGLADEVSQVSLDASWQRFLPQYI